MEIIIYIKKWSRTNIWLIGSFQNDLNVFDDIYIYPKFMVPNSLYIFMYL
jgi:hypothetical protein